MTTETESRSAGKALEIAAGAAVLVTAFVLCLRAGLRGFFPFDQSIVFDGSYRVLSGQVPYKDFLVPFGPVTFWLHSVFFRFLGVNYEAYVTGAAVMNAGASLVAMLTVRTIFPRLRFLPLVAGILTAVWFYPPFGTPWADQTAFFFALLAVGVLVKGLFSDPEALRRHVLLVASGCFAVISFLSKQNVGSFMIFLFPLAIAVGEWGRPRRLLLGLVAFAVGVAATAGAFLIWLVTSSDFGAFVRYFFEIPAQLGEERMSELERTWFGIVRPFFGGRGPGVMSGALLASLAVCVAVLAAFALKRRCEVSRRHVVASVLCIYLLGVQHVFINTTLNQPENGLGLSGLAIAIAAGLLLSYTSLGRGKLRLATVAGLAVFVFFASAAGYGVAMRRDVHEMFRGADFGPPLPIHNLRGLKWAEPTLIRGRVVRREHIVFLYRYLEESGENFFVFPDFTFFYGLLGVPSPQPLLWFHEGVTYSRDDNGDLDERIVDALGRNHVGIVVYEQAAWFDPGERLDDFPRLEAFIRDGFEKIGEIGMFSIYERR
jgi:hypothetical protein